MHRQALPLGFRLPTWLRRCCRIVLAAPLVFYHPEPDEAAAPSSHPFVLHRVATFNYPWRIAFCPDGRMLITEKPGRLWLVTQAGVRMRIAGVPAVRYDGQGGLLGVYLGPDLARDRAIYLTYAEPGGGGTSGLALARASLTPGPRPRLDRLRVVWREFPKGRGGQFGGALAFSPDRQFLFLAVGDRQRMTPAQDPDLPQGKILRLTLEGQPAPGNPHAGALGASRVRLIDPPRDTVAARHAPAVAQFSWPGPNRTPAETWALGFRNPYGLAFTSDGRLWELEHGPLGGDELNLVEPGRNYGWPWVSAGVNYDHVPIPRPGTRPDLVRAVVTWTPVIAPGNLLVYHGRRFADWRGSALASGLVSEALDRIMFDGSGGARVVARYPLGFRVRDVAEAPDGAIWVIDDDGRGGLYRLTPR